ncbi:small acidic protein 1-like, partial [Trifolium pratense]
AKYQFDFRKIVRKTVMRAMDLFGEMEEQITSMAMEVDDGDNLDILAEGLVTESKLVDAEFFNSFHDDFDDADIN